MRNTVFSGAGPMLITKRYPSETMLGILGRAKGPPGHLENTRMKKPTEVHLPS